MRSSLSDDIEGAEQSIIDWYDGIVSSIASLDQQQVFVSLLAWDQEVDKKVYAVVPIDGAISDSMRLLLSDDPGTTKQERWDAIQDQIAQLRSSCRGTALLVECRQFGKRPTMQKEVEIDDDLRAQLGRGVEVALEKKNVDKWFRLVGGDI